MSSKSPRNDFQKHRCKFAKAQAMENSETSTSLRLQSSESFPVIFEMLSSCLLFRSLKARALLCSTTNLSGAFQHCLQDLSHDNAFSRPVDVATQRLLVIPDFQNTG
jgi:hypothetical protein